MPMIPGYQRCLLPGGWRAPRWRRVAAPFMHGGDAWLGQLFVPLLLLLTAGSACAQTLGVLDRFSGCYALEWGDWAIANSRADSTWIPAGIERRVWLTSTPIVDPDTSWRVVRPAPGTPASEFGEVRWTWRTTDEKVVIEWDATMSGIRVELDPTTDESGMAASLAGTARWWSTDQSVPPKLSARVAARRQPCFQP